VDRESTRRREARSPASAWSHPLRALLSEQRAADPQGVLRPSQETHSSAAVGTRPGDADRV